MSQTSAGPQIVEAYKNYSPTFDVSKTIRLLLRYVPANYLVGLRTIVLTNQGALSHDRRRRKLLSRGRRYSMDRVLGSYHQAWKGELAWIQIFVDRIIANMPKGTDRVSLLRNIAVADVLYHEIGHHIHKTSRPEFREREDVADSWKHKLASRFARKRYWYLHPFYIGYRFVKNAQKFFRRAKSKRGVTA